MSDSIGGNGGIEMVIESSTTNSANILDNVSEVDSVSPTGPSSDSSAVIGMDMDGGFESSEHIPKTKALMRPRRSCVLQKQKGNENVALELRDKGYTD